MKMNLTTKAHSVQVTSCFASPNIPLSPGIMFLFHFASGALCLLEDKREEAAGICCAHIQDFPAREGKPPVPVTMLHTQCSIPVCR